MGDFLIVLGGLITVLILIAIGIYNRFDRQRFMMERMLRGVDEPLTRWVSVCEALRGIDSGYRRAKRLADRTACLRALVAETKQSCEEKLDLQEQLLEFCLTFNTLADRFDRQLTGSLSGKAAALLGFRPIGHIDFYPDVKA